jgi:predicted transcriptional regulator
MPEHAPERSELLSLTSDIVVAYAGNNELPKDELPDLISKIFETVSGLGAEPPEAGQEPAVPRDKSISNKALTCLECGGQHKMLKRHLANAHGLTPAEYRAKWGLPPHYPMVSPDYAVVRSKLAKEIGLGRKTKTSGGQEKKA